MRFDLHSDLRSGFKWIPILLIAATLSISFFLSACGRGAPKKPLAVGPVPVIGTDQAADPAALFDTVGARALRGDTVGLARLLVDDSTFRRNIYPLSPAFEPARPDVFRFVLGMHKANSAKGLRRMLHDVSAGAGTLLSLPYADTVKTAEGTLYTPAEPAAGTSGIRLFGAILCRPRGCQVVSFAPGGAL